MIDYLRLTKPRVTMMVLVTAAIGFELAGGGTLATLALVLAGTALAAGGTSALNMVLERREDARMRRTASRPLPSGRLRPDRAFVFAVACTAAGIALLAAFVNDLAAALAAASMINYVILYTPLKKRTPLSVAVGAVSGAIPPLIGWAASRGALGGEAWLLFAVLFLWQLPHFLSIAWLYREDYDRAGFRVFSGSAGLQAVAWTLVLVALTLVPGGWIYRAGAALLGTAFVAAALHFATAKTQRGARRLLLASIAYLPVLLLLLLARG